MLRNQVTYNEMNVAAAAASNFMNKGLRHVPDLAAGQQGSSVKAFADEWRTVGHENSQDLTQTRYAPGWGGWES